MVKRFIQYIPFSDRPLKGGDILDFYKGVNLRKRGLTLKSGEYDPPYLSSIILDICAKYGIPNLTQPSLQIFDFLIS